MKKTIVLSLLASASLAFAQTLTETVGDYTYTFRTGAGGAHLAGGISPLPTGDFILPETLGGEPVITIGRAFDGCNDLKSVKIPPGVTTVEPGVFKDTAIWDNHPDGIVYVDGWVCGVKGAKPAGDLVLREGTRGIADMVFMRCDKLTSVVIPQGAVSIGVGAFESCTGLTSVTFPPSVATIGRMAFYGCGGLTRIVLPEGVATIGPEAFIRCANLTDVKIPSSVTRIHMGAFHNTVLWENHPDGIVYVDGWVCGFKGDPPAGDLVLREGTRGISEFAMKGCVNLTSVLIPPSVRGIGRGAFDGCTGLTSITIPCGSIYHQFNKNPLTHVTITPGAGSTVWGHPPTAFFYDEPFRGHRTLESVVIMEGVTTIQGFAFAYCQNLTNVEIPSSVTSISDNAFLRCDKLNLQTLEKIKLIQ